MYSFPKPLWPVDSYYMRIQRNPVKELTFHSQAKDTENKQHIIQIINKCNLVPFEFQEHQNNHIVFKC